MREGQFRSVSEWKSALMTLADGAFFDLIRGYLGDIKTPFNKQRLVDELESLLSRQEVQKTMEAYMDPTDRKVLAAVGLLGFPSPGELASFFEGEYSFAEFHGILLNLEERLLVYRFTDQGIHRFALNPVLENLLAPVVMDTDTLFPSYPLSSESSAVSPIRPLDDVLLAALLAYAFSHPELHRANGKFKKKTQDEIEALFPSLDVGSLLEALKIESLLRLENGNYVPEKEKIDRFIQLSPVDRMIYVASGMVVQAVASDSENPLRRVSRERIQLVARLIKLFLGSLSDNRWYPEISLNRHLDVLERSLDEGSQRWASASPGLRKAHPIEGRFGVSPSVFRGTVYSVLEQLGLLRKVEGPGWTKYLASEVPRSDSPRVVYQGPFSLILYPETAFKDAYALALFCDLKEVGRTIQFEIRRESVVRSFDWGETQETLRRSIEAATGIPIDQTLLWSLTEWQKRYAGLSLQRGLVLVVEEERRYLVNAEPVAQFIDRTLAPGVYLLKGDDEEPIIQALKKTGADIVALPRPPSMPPRPVVESHHPPFPPLVSGKLEKFGIPSSPRKEDSAPGPGFLNPTEVMESFKRVLEKKNLPKDQRDELTARIERRLIVSEAQLVGAAVRYEKLEARGLDYVGKVRVAEQALSSHSLVELFWRGPKGEPNRLLGNPRALEKSGGEVKLVLDPVPEGESLSIPIGKISLLRRIKRSIFE